MDDRPIKTLLDLLPEYLNFSISFLRSPEAAFSPYALKGRVHVDLTSFLLAGVGVAYLAVSLMPHPALQLQQPQGAADRFALWLTRQDPRLLPVEALLLVLGLAIAAHLVAKLFDRLGSITAKSRTAEPNFPGGTEDSVNAGLGFAAVMLPLTTFAFLAALSLATPAAGQRLGQTLLVLVIAGTLALYVLLAIFCYLIPSFAAVHRVSYARAASALSVAFVCMALAAENIP